MTIDMEFQELSMVVLMGSPWILLPQQAWFASDDIYVSGVYIHLTVTSWSECRTQIQIPYHRSSMPRNHLYQGQKRDPKWNHQPFGLQLNCWKIWKESPLFQCISMESLGICWPLQLKVSVYSRWFCKQNPCLLAKRKNFVVAGRSHVFFCSE